MLLLEELLTYSDVTAAVICSLILLLLSVTSFHGHKHFIRTASLTLEISAHVCIMHTILGLLQVHDRVPVVYFLYLI